ncbi:MAG: aminopeptidase [Bacillota bacterium]
MLSNSEAELRRVPVNAWDILEEDQKDQVMGLAEKYKIFLDGAKTERQGVERAVEAAKRQGFLPLDSLPGFPEPGQGFFWVTRHKAIVLGVGGIKPFQEGFRLVGAHLDAPRLDLKPNPLYEGEGLALWKTHYYGGVKKYQWTSIPLALHGVVIARDGRKVAITIGEEASDPVFTITDLLPHLAKDQLKKKLGEAIKGEDLNVLVASIPGGNKGGKDRFKLQVLDLLHQRYGMVEEDFAAAELELVPAGQARDIGLDRSMVGAYGQDDRVCAFTALEALLDVGVPAFTSLVVLADKEEIGSTGNTGMGSQFFKYLVADLAERGGLTSYAALGRIFLKSRALSADTTTALDPTYENVLDKNNAARLGSGVVLTKYTGAGGKYHANDANAEFLGEVRTIFNRNGIAWQVGELGKVDQGGGGTIAQYLANYGMDVVDCGPPLLSIHAPLEISSKVDIYMAFKAYKVFLAEGGEVCES